MRVYQKISSFEFWGNTGADYLLALAVFLGTLLIFKVFTSWAIARVRKVSEKTKNDIDDFLVDLIASIKPPFYFLISFYLALRLLVVEGTVHEIVFGFFIFIVVLQSILILQKTIDFGVKKMFLKEDDKKESNSKTDQDKEAMIRLTAQLGKGVLWVLGGLLILSNLGVNINSLLAGLGIGGIAIALALQNILGDLFASFSIFIDKPFKVGDYIVSGAESGTVKKIGVKTTRLKTLQGEELVVPNKDLVNARVGNFKKMEKRRASFEVGVVYETEFTQLKKVPEIIKEAIEEVENTEFGNAHFSKYGDFALIFGAYYYVTSSKFEKYTKAKNEINYKLFEKFKENGLEFAYPTQTVFVKNSGKG